MPLPNRAATPLLMTALFSGICCAQEWTESAVIERFLKQTPYTREGRARVAIAQAEARGRTFYPNPILLFSHESAGLTEFFQAEQRLPVSGRLKLLREAGASFVQATEADAAFSLWQARSSLRQAFYRLVASQKRETVYSTNLKDIDDVVRVLRERELQGEGSEIRSPPNRARAGRTPFRAGSAALRRGAGPCPTASVFARRSAGTDGCGWRPNAGVFDSQCCGSYNARVSSPRRLPCRAAACSAIQDRTARGRTIARVDRRNGWTETCRCRPAENRIRTSCRRLDPASHFQ